jgi:ATP-dependent RNA helicase RhlB
VGNLDLSRCSFFVLDEADRMLDMGFIPDVRRIISRLPSKDKRTTMLYSATLDEAVMRLAMNWMNEPYKAEVESQTNATDTVKQVVYVIQAKDKFTVLYNHIALHPSSRTIVFCNRKSTTEDVYESLKVRGVSVEMLSGDVNQNKRLKVLDQFRAGKVNVVVATDVAGRGLDVKGLEYVVNFDFPYEAEDYVHRIGRTGRAKRQGSAYTFMTDSDKFRMRDILKYTRSDAATMVFDENRRLIPAAESENNDEEE